LKVVNDRLGFQYVEIFVENAYQSLVNSMQLDNAFLY